MAVFLFVPIMLRCVSRDWHIATFAALQHSWSLGVTADIDRPPFDLFPRSLNFIVDDLSRFVEGFGWRCERHRCAQPQPVFIEYRHDETGLAGEIEAVEIVSLGLEDHGLRSHAALKSAIASSRVAAYPRSCVLCGTRAVIVQNQRRSSCAAHTKDNG